VGESVAGRVTDVAPDDGAPGGVVVVGAGAAGLWAAARVARTRPDARVLLLEKTARTGTKVLASGGTRCNLTTTLDARAAGELFGPAGARFLAPSLRTLGPEDVRAHFAALGVPTVEAPLEKVFPKSGRARDVRDALEHEARAAGVELMCDAGVLELEPRDERARPGSGGWRLALASGQDIDAARVILCPGGKSYARTGTTGDGYAWLERLGLPLVAPVPALVPLASSAAWVTALAGVSVQDAEARLLDERRRVLGRRRRPVLFTHQGLSGPAAMDLSVHVARGAPGARFTLELDLVPDLEREALRARLIEAAGRKGAPGLVRALDLPLARRIVLAALRQADYAEEPRANTLDKAGRHRIVEALKGLAVPIDKTLGFDQAEVTAGGLALTHVAPGTMRVRGYENLWACGELLDLQGPIGGLNFLAAFATAETAGRDAAR